MAFDGPPWDNLSPDPNSYTSLWIDSETGWWMCPEPYCRQPKADTQAHNLLLRGYKFPDPAKKETPGKSRYIYEGCENYEDFVFFLNPPSAVRCMRKFTKDEWRTPCRFSRSETDRHLNTDASRAREQQCDKLKNSIIGYCLDPDCFWTDDQWENHGLGGKATDKALAAITNPFTEEPVYARYKAYRGDRSHLTCGTPSPIRSSRKEGSCPNRYGGLWYNISM